jgi:hypothetical protein
MKPSTGIFSYSFAEQNKQEQYELVEEQEGTTDKKIKKCAFIHPVLVQEKDINNHVITNKQGFGNLFCRLLNEKNKEQKKKNNIGKKPIGIRGDGYNGLINALMQFIIHTPSLRNIFNFVPKSLRLFNSFIDQYEMDEERGVLSVCDSKKITAFILEQLSCLKKGMAISEALSVYEVLDFLTRLVDTKYVGEILTFHYEKRISSEDNFIENYFRENFTDNILPYEYLLCVKESLLKEKPILLPLHYFIGQKTYYDLDSFIEYRKAENYVAYLKVGGCWYQCDDERVMALRSNNLSMPLSYGVLFHYKMVKFIHKQHEDSRIFQGDLLTLS